MTEKLYFCTVKKTDMMRKTTLLLSFLACQAFIAGAQDRQMSGNPVFEGWYADPEAIVYGRTCWIYPTTSDLYV